MQKKILISVASDSPGNTKSAFLSNLSIQGSQASVNIGFVYKDSNEMVLGTGVGQTLTLNLQGADDPNMAGYSPTVRAAMQKDQERYNKIIAALETVIKEFVDEAIPPVTE